MTTLEIKQAIQDDSFDKSDLINTCLDLCHQIEKTIELIAKQREEIESMRHALENASLAFDVLSNSNTHDAMICARLSKRILMVLEEVGK